MSLTASAATSDSMTALMASSFHRRLRPAGALSRSLLAPLPLVVAGASLGLATLLLLRGAALSALAIVVWGALAYVAIVVAERRRAAHHDARAVPPPPAVAPALSDALVSVPQDLDENSAQRFEELVEEALRGLNEPGRLAKLELGQALPRTLAAANGGQPPSGLEGGRLLREVVVAAVDRLKPVDADSSP